MIAKYLHAIGTFLIGIALLIGVLVGSNAIRTGLSPRTIVVTGKAVRQLESNQSKVSGSWHEKAPTSAEARNATQKKAADGIAAIKQLGIEDKYIKTVESSVYPEYDYTIITNREPKILDYKGTTTVEVTLTDPKKADAVLAALTKSGTETTSGPSFGLSTEASDALQKELKVAAVADAHIQAEALSKQAGTRLGDVITVSGGGLSGAAGSYPTYKGLGTADMVASTTAEPAPSDLEVGQNEVSVTVTVTYRLR